jgi:hypothetical protein
MRNLIANGLTIVAITYASAGCVSKTKAKADAQAAYLAGQQQTMARMQLQSASPSVKIVGNVANNTLPWTEDLTVAKAIVAAGYLGTKDPGHIFLVRGGRALPVDPKQLLVGQDIPLQQGDVLQIAP